MLINAWLVADTEAGPLDDRLGHSITYRIAVGPRAGQKLFTLQPVAPRLQGLDAEPNGAARAGGFSLHAGMDIASHRREKLERLCRQALSEPETAFGLWRMDTGLEAGCADVNDRLYRQGASVFCKRKAAPPTPLQSPALVRFDRALGLCTKCQIYFYELRVTIPLPNPCDTN